VTGPHACQIIGRWRIVEADLWDLDLVEPDRPDSRKTVPSRSSYPSTTATTPPSPLAANDYFNSLLAQECHMC
jgi:hypothetical protein